LPTGSIEAVEGVGRMETWIPWAAVIGVVVFLALLFFAC
jgi:hypothetical protein